MTCRVLGFSKQAFYKWRANPVTERDWDDAHLINAALDIHHDDPEFGYRFIADELAERGITAARTGSAGCAQQQRIWSVLRQEARPRAASPARRSTTTWSSAHFTAAAPNLLWLTDITEHPTAEGKLYLCAIKDVCSNRIVGYSMDSRMTADARGVGAANAVALRGPAAPWSIPTAAASSAPTPSSARSRTTGCSGRWAGSAPAATTPPWNRSSRCCRRTSSTARRWTTREELRAGDHDLDRTDLPPPTPSTTRLGRLTPIEFETLLQAAHAS